jgi:hypothetical protein
VSTPAALAATVRQAVNMTPLTYYKPALAALAELERLAAEERQIAHDMFQDARSESLRAEAAEARSQQFEEALRELDDEIQGHSGSLDPESWVFHIGVIVSAVLAAGGPTKDTAA